MCRVVTTRRTTLFVGFATPRTIEWKIKSKWSDVHDPRGQLRIVKAVHASVWRPRLRDMLHIDRGRENRPAKHADAPVVHRFTTKLTTRN
jgi:hypothetical protein